MGSEQRKYVRFSAKDDLFAALRNGFKNVGKIQDISVKGMAFSYLNEITQMDPADHHTQVDIFTLRNEFHLFNVPCRIVYKTLLAAHDEGFSLGTFKCGLHFEKLSAIQLDLLNFFIKKYTIKTRPMKEMPKTLNNHVNTT